MKVFKAVYKDPTGDLFAYEEIMTPGGMVPDNSGCELVHFVVEEVDEEYLTLEDGNV